MNMISRLVELIRRVANRLATFDTHPEPEKITEAEKTLDVEGVRYTALQVLIQKRALEDEVSSRHRTTYELVRLAARFVFRDLQVSDAQLVRLSSLTGTPAFQ